MLGKLAPVLLCLIFLLGCGSAQTVIETTVSTEETFPEATQIVATEATEATSGFDPCSIVDTIPIETLVGQLFLGSCPGKDSALEDIAAFQPGGFVLFGGDFKEETPHSLQLTLEAYQNTASIPMIFAVDEEGGTVTRISCYSQFRNEPFPAPRQLYEQGGQEAVLAAEEEKSTLLHIMGIHVNLGPVCDVTTDRNSFMYDRSLGLSPQSTGNVITSMVRTMSSNGIGSVLKHFPGYGNNVDTHTGSALDTRSLQQLVENDLIPFGAGIAAGCDAIMVSHTVIAALDETTPASLSPAVHQFLREHMGFDGIIMTDDLIMDAISDTYGDGEAAVLAVLAGNDMLCTGAFQKQYPAVLEAVRSGRIPLDSVKESVSRILQWKYELGLIT